VLSACSHAGIVNTALDAQAAFPGQPLDVLLGGYHLAGAAMEQRIPATMRDLLDSVEPALFAPGHCSGWRLKTALASAAPERYAPSVVGARYDLAATLTPGRQREPWRSA
jgi:7,8-dihydropterin-6-yl-methyl-4-(beta-D-ribofuranosyl)aminobenzene 5'-phosphate synthase